MKINTDKLTDFETQLATMFELRIGDVSASPFELRVPDMPLIAITRWGARVVPPQPGTTATWYRSLTWRGKILARQLHRRACARVVDEKVSATEAMDDAKWQAALSGLNTAAAGLAQSTRGCSKAQILGDTSYQRMLDSYQYVLNKQMVNGVNNLANAAPSMQAARPLNTPVSAESLQLNKL